MRNNFLALFAVIFVISIFFGWGRVDAAQTIWSTRYQNMLEQTPLRSDTTDGEGGVFYSWTCPITGGSASWVAIGDSSSPECPQVPTNPPTYTDTATFQAWSDKDTYAPGERVNINISGGSGYSPAGENTRGLNAIPDFFFGCGGLFGGSCPSVPWSWIAADFRGVRIIGCGEKQTCSAAGFFDAPTTPGVYTVDVDSSYNSIPASSSFQINVSGGYDCANPSSNVQRIFTAGEPWGISTADNPPPESERCAPGGVSYGFSQGALSNIQNTSGTAGIGGWSWQCIGPGSTEQALQSCTANGNCANCFVPATPSVGVCGLGPPNGNFCEAGGTKVDIDVVGDTTKWQCRGRGDRGTLSPHICCPIGQTAQTNSSGVEVCACPSPYVIGRTGTCVLPPNTNCSLDTRTIELPWGAGCFNKTLNVSGVKVGENVVVLNENEAYGGAINFITFKCVKNTDGSSRLDQIGQKCDLPGKTSIPACIPVTSTAK